MEVILMSIQSSSYLVASTLLLFLISVLGITGFYQPQEALGNGPNVFENPYHVPKTSSTYLNNMMSGGPPKDGIPSIDNPQFVSASQASSQFLEPNDIVIGYQYDGQAKAYPRQILVHHEIVNDEISGKNVSVTYCPLTATAQGFERGATTLGVSGRLINSNLVIYDRATDSFYPQILATGIKGPNKGQSMKEFNVVWTTWQKWKKKYPETRVMSTETGFLRNYNQDPYGNYNPRSGYYTAERTMFPLMNSPSDLGPKKMILGARTSERSVYVPMKKLREQNVLRTDSFVVVYDGELDTGYVYSIGASNVRVHATGTNKYRLDGQSYEPSELPLTRHVSIEGFYFAWNAFYPDSETI